MHTGIFLEHRQQNSAILPHIATNIAQNSLIIYITAMGPVVATVQERQGENAMIMISMSYVAVLVTVGDTDAPDRATDMIDQIDARGAVDTLLGQIIS